MKPEDLKGAICATLGHGGATVYFEKNAGRWSGWIPDQDGPTIEAAGVPVWDFRVIEWGQLAKLAISGPMLAQDGKLDMLDPSRPAPGPFDKLPYVDWIRPYIDAGATRPYAKSTA